MEVESKVRRMVPGDFAVALSMGIWVEATAGGSLFQAIEGSRWVFGLVMVMTDGRPRLCTSPNRAFFVNPRLDASLRS